MTSFGTNGCNEYEHNESKIKNVDIKIKRMKVCKKYVRKQSLWKQEQRKEHYIDEIHWKTIKSLLSCNDVLFYGDIKSHNIVRGNKNRTLNRDTNNLKFYKFKERLLFKASEQRKIVICTKEHYTTKTCSFCGTMNEPGISKLYYCSSCKKRVGRDVNAAKNILMKGLVKHV
jgi:putative transposase